MRSSARSCKSSPSYPTTLTRKLASIRASGSASEAHALTTPDAFDCGVLDRWTAFLSLFHEHEWEPPILRAALASHCFYVGALGSRRTAEARRETLAEMGVAASEIARIHGPVGLDLGARSPPEIALAILGQIVQQRRQPRT